MEKVGSMNLVLQTANVRKYTYKSIISNENLASNFKCAASVKYTPDFKDLVGKKVIKY